MKRILGLGLALTMFLTACSSGSTGSTGSTGSSGSGKTLKVGMIAPLSGDAKTYGDSGKSAFLLAMEQINYKVGDIKIETVIGDDRNDATEGVNLANKMISQDGVKAIVGAITSKVTIPVSELANQNKIVMITGTSTNAKVTVDDKGNRKPFAFRACFIDPFQGEVAAKFATKTLKAKSAAVLYDKGNDYTVGLAEAFKANFEKNGGKIVAWESYAKDDSDFSALMTKVAGTKPDMLYLPDYYNKVSLIGKAAKAKGLIVPMLGGDGWDSSDLDYATMAGSYFTNHYSADDTRPEVQKFVAEYKAKYGTKPDAFAALVYDATNLMLQGVRASNSTDPDKIRQAMQDLKGFKTVSGEVSFDKNGNPIKAAAILQVKADKTYGFVETVSP